MRRHLDLIRRKELLELALDKMESLKKLDTLERRKSSGSGGARQASQLTAAGNNKDRGETLELILTSCFSCS